MSAAYLEPGSQFADFSIEDVIGRGGMGVVYRARWINVGREVALKVMAPEVAHDETSRARFQRESRVAASVDHPNVVTVYEVGEHGEQLYIAMQLIAGPSFESLIAAGGLPPRPRRAHPRSGRERRSRPRTRSASCTATSSPATCSWTSATTPT